MRRLYAVALLCALALLNVPPDTARAQQSDSGEIHIVVTDAVSKQPLELARVLLDGAVIVSELTNKSGKVDFTDVPDGIYRARVVKRGYTSLTSASFEVINGRIVTVSMSLVEDTGGLKVIGTVSVKASATISSTSINENSPQRRLSDDLAGALNKLSGVSVSTSSDDSDSPQTISLEGHDPSQTQLTLDGIPLNAPGSAGNLGAYATDLFTGASVHQGQTLGAAGGAVNFSTLQPTLTWLSTATLTAGSYGKYNYGFSETGSIDRLGIAAQTVYRQTPSLVDGLPPYLDASGFDYVHDGDTTITGSLLKLRYQFSDSQTVSGTFLSSARDTNLVCLRAYSPPALPCGYGPNNSSEGSVQLYSLTDNALLGATQVQASVYTNTTQGLLDEVDRFVDGVAAPIGYSSLAQTQGFSINATLPAKERHTISIQAYGTNTTSSTTPLVPQAQQYYNGSQQTQYSAIQATDAIHSNDKLTLLGSAGVSTATGSLGATLIATAGATWRPNALDSLTASYSLGGVAPTAGRAQILTDPASLRFDCNGNVAYGNAPGQQPGPSSSNSERLAYTHLLHGGSLTLTLYNQVQDGVLLPVLVNGSVLNQLDQLPFGYVSQARAIYQSAAGCNTAAASNFTPRQLYFTTPVTGVQRTYQGGSIAGYATFGDLIAQPYYDVTVAKASSTSPYFANPYAITIAGQQLPNVPLQKAGLVLDFKAPHSIFEWLADAQYTSKNNPNNLPAYVTFDAGVSAQTSHGVITVAESNITNTYSGIFAGPTYAVPYTTLGGFDVATTARPLAPRSYSVTYTARFGAGASAYSPSSLSLPRSGGGRGGGPEGGGPGPEGGPRGPGGSGGPGGGGGGFARLFSPLPTSPPADPFALNQNAQTCTAAGQTAAKQLSGELKAYVAQIEAAKTAAGYPATFQAPAFSDATVTYHALAGGKQYALSIVPHFQAGGTGGFRTLVGCMSIHLARADDVTARQLYAPASTLFFVPQAYFMPEVGIYFVARRQQAGQEQFRIYRLPATPPKDPFAIRASDACTGDARNLATQSMDQLRAYVTNGVKPNNWTVVTHAAKAGTWYEFQPSDPTLIAAAITCGRIAAATQDELTQRGFGGAPVPALNFAAPLGLYVIRPNRPAGP